MALTASPRPVGTRVAGFGHYQPTTVVTNEDLIVQGVNTNDEWIKSRVGIAERRFAVDESVLDMAEAAASKAIASSGVAATDIDLVILATCTNVAQVPGGAATLAHRLGIEGPGAWLVSAAALGSRPVSIFRR